MNFYKLSRPGIKVGYDEAAGFVVRAHTSQEARRLASQKAGGERDLVWLDPKQSKCTLIRPAGRPAVVMRDFNAG